MINKNLVPLLKKTLAILGFIFVGYMFFNILIPGVESIVGIVYVLLEFYTLLEMPYTFFGTALLLFIFWKIVIMLISVCGTILRLSAKPFKKKLKMCKECKRK